MLFSNNICAEFSEANPDHLPMFGKLTVGLMGIISSFMDYKELMLKIRYVNKDWILFTQKYLCYIKENRAWSRFKTA